MNALHNRCNNEIIAMATSQPPTVWILCLQPEKKGGNSILRDKRRKCWEHQGQCQKTTLHDSHGLDPHIDFNI